MRDSYLDYLASAHWRQLRARKAAASDYRCDRCGFYAQRDHEGRRFGIEVHHRTYERIGHEDLADLETLCKACHRDQHGINGPTAEADRARITNRINGRLGFDFEPDTVELEAMGLQRDEIAVEVDAWEALAEQAGQ